MPVSFSIWTEDQLHIKNEKIKNHILISHDSQN